MRAGSSLFIGLAGVLCLGLAAGTSAPAAAGDGPDPVVELGRRLFFDASVSRTGTVACSSCHDPDHGFSDARVISADEHGPAPRHSQTVLNLSDRSFHWDGEFKTIGELVSARIALPDVAAHETEERVKERHRIAGDGADDDLLRRRNVATTSGGYPGLAPQPVVVNPPQPLASIRARQEPVTQRLEGDRRYASAFDAAFGSTDVTTDRIGEALEAYLRTLRSTDSSYDAFAAGDAAALTPSASRGHELFTGKAGCATCHTLDRDGDSPRFRNTGVAAAQLARAPALARRSAAAAARAAELLSQETGHGQDLHLVANVSETQDDAGRAGVTLLKGDRRKFKVPNLRDVALRAPYMHDGSLATLDDVVSYYNDGGTKDAGLHAGVKALGLDANQRHDLVAFLEALTGTERAGLGPRPANRPARHEIRVVDLSGHPIPGLSVTVRPAGDRFEGTARMPGTFTTVTREDGTLSFPFPATTHVTFEAEGYEVGVGRAMPDVANGLELRATPQDTVSIRIRRRPNDPEFPEELRVVESVGMQIVIEPGDDHGTALRLVDKSGSALTLTRIGGEIDDYEAIFAAPVPAGAKKMLMHVDFNGDSVGPFEIDLTGGASEPIDFGAPPPARTAGLGQSFDFAQSGRVVTGVVRSDVRVTLERALGEFVEDALKLAEEQTTEEEDPE